MTADNAYDEAPTPPRWDPLIRIVHWGIAAAVLANGLVTEEGGPIHVWIGYAAFAFLALRLIWGIVGPEEARFAAFPPSLAAARAHVGRLFSGTHRRYRSHNPLGALMVYALWGTLAVVALTGIAMAGSPFDAGSEREARAVPTVVAASYDGEEDDEDHGEYGEGNESEAGEALEEVHEVAANLLLILAAFHVGGVALESRLSGRNLVRGMVTGAGEREAR